MTLQHKNSEVQKAFDKLHIAIETREVAVGRAVANVYAQFARIVARREKEYNDALRHSKQEAGDAMDD